MKWTIATEEAGYSVRDYLKRKHAFSRRLLRKLKETQGSIHVNEKVQRFGYILQKGDRVDVTFPPEEAAERLEANPVPLDIIYEDETFLIIDKQANLASIPSMNHPRYTLANGLLAYYQRNGIQSTVHVVTRLDKYTSGLMLIAKNRYSHALFSRMQQFGGIKRKYIAVVDEKPPKEFGTIDAPIGRKEGSIIERTVTDTDAGKQAVTDYRIKHTNENTGTSFVEAEPQTGRTHQIRVHLAYIGHPIIGDDLYGETDERIKRQALHCHELTFTHPFTHETHTFHAPLPCDMQTLC